MASFSALAVVLSTNLMSIYSVFSLFSLCMIQSIDLHRSYSSLLCMLLYRVSDFFIMRLLLEECIIDLDSQLLLSLKRSFYDILQPASPLLLASD